jgi:NADH-ubiquinone oxidoreductase chain 5
MLVTSGNYIQLFIGWEGVGLCSYFLINFWFTRLLANKSALKAMLVNRIGDIFLLISFGLIYYIFLSFDFCLIFSLINYYKYSYIFLFGYYFHSYSLISFFLLLGAFGKSAQLGLHTWLPDAMEGPTPVSALIHAATMVTAGVFLIIRSSFFFNYSYLILFILLFIGSATAFFGSVVACFQYDIKKIIAYSTCSQLGYMFVSCGLMHYDLALFHLFNHAFFKALLFLSSGVLIHGLLDEQDIRKMGGLLFFYPFIYISFFIGSYSLMGLPFLSGFFSKDLILETAFSFFEVNYFYIYFLLIVSAAFTIVYSLKLLYFVFFSFPKNSFICYNLLSYESIFILLVLFFLNLLSIFSGYFFKDLFFGSGSYFFCFSISYFFTSLNIYNNFEYLFFSVKLIPIFLFIFIFFLCFFFFRLKEEFLYIYSYKSNSKSNYNYIFFYFFNKKFFFDYIYNFYISLKILDISYFIFYKKIDKNLLEILGSNGFYFLFFNISKFLSLIFSNYFNIYIIVLIVGFLFYYIYIYFVLLDLFIFFFLYIFFFFLKKKNIN